MPTAVAHVCLSRGRAGGAWLSCVVSFRKRQVEGFVVGLRSDAPEMEVLPVTQVIDSSALLRPEIFELCQWISKYYVSPIGEVLKAALPPGIKAEVVETAARSAGGLPSPGLRPPSPGERDLACNTPSARPILTEDQSSAFEAITSGGGFHPVLLHGVTGSGKTEVYIRAAEHFLAPANPRLILVPEIGLTPQLTDRFCRALPGKPPSCTAR